MPKGPHAAAAGSVDTASVVPSEDFKTERRAKHADYGIDQRGDNGDLDAARPGKLRKTRVVMRADFAGASVASGFGGSRRSFGAGHLDRMVFCVTFRVEVPG